MVKIILSLLFVSLSTFADDDLRTTRESDWGHFEISMVPRENLAYNQYLFGVSAVCKDQRSGERALHPPASEPLIVDENKQQGIFICKFLGHEETESYTKLTLHYLIEEVASQPKPRKGPRKKDCLSQGQEYKLVFDLKKICKVWGPDKN